MQTEDMLLIGVLIVAGILFMKFVYWTVGRDFSRWAKYQQDPEFRKSEITRLDGVLEQNPQDSVSLLLRAQLWRMDGENSKAMEDLQKYLTIKSSDSEGWAELCECALCLDDADLAVDAAEKAIGFDGEYADYRAMRLRAALAQGDVVRARKELTLWQDLDCKRVAAGSRTKSIFKSDQRHFGELVADPALIAYEAAVASAEGDNVSCARLVEQMKKEHTDLWGELRENDPLLARLS